MSTKELIDSAVEHLYTSASVKTVYGEPIVIDGKTIIPVAKVAYGFGGGTGTKQGTEKNGKEPAPSEAGESAGGAVAAKPVGVVEISGQETKFVSFGQARKLASAAVIGSGIGFVLGVLLGRRGKG
jgi:uncharacterized spore protein YtfJ